MTLFFVHDVLNTIGELDLSSCTHNFLVDIVNHLQPLLLAPITLADLILWVGEILLPISLPFGVFICCNKEMPKV